MVSFIKTQVDGKNYFVLQVSYNGTNYSGWVIQKNALTIQGCLNRAIKIVTKTNKFRTIGASKTDAGVHALDQRVWLELEFMPNLQGFVKGINKALPDDIQVMGIKQVKSDFYIRNTKSKLYKYQINNGFYNIEKENFMVFYDRCKLNLAKIKSLAKIFVGEHDFFLFSGLSQEESLKISTKRRIDKIFVKRNKQNQIIIFFQAKGFIRYQIRVIIQTILALYEGKITISRVKDALSGDGSKIPYKANPKGLTLVKITY
ncbi:tRNA pseudouridine synthase A [Spiroplasma sabaudiense Ar-1343]|uniref:tRNA pseudouridine synthase A n=1 Tax=Spiroplasma sabaudiense Ar-1343 TaxID=1276257 RepID=W6AAP2_9MOLU|nr:tRNA pseudouridine(38-40) synthase TruA [Spiroplasma sabaudiense]AHI54127.1 tRNA pseudouridine synthase A [Spiroplasma sabaudiense Ar-1343]